MVLPFHHLVVGAHADPGQPLLPAGVAFPVEVHDTLCHGPRIEKLERRRRLFQQLMMQSPPDSIASPYVIRVAVTDETLPWSFRG